MLLIVRYRCFMTLIQLIVYVYLYHVLLLLLYNVCMHRLSWLGDATEIPRVRRGTMMSRDNTLRRVK
jgi:hypothetical protein